MGEYWLALVRSWQGNKLHAADGNGWPLCLQHGAFWRSEGFGKPDCKHCLKCLDEIVAEQTRERAEVGG